MSSVLLFFDDGSPEEIENTLKKIKRKLERSEKDEITQPRKKKKFVGAVKDYPSNGESILPHTSKSEPLQTFEECKKTVKGGKRKRRLSSRLERLLHAKEISTEKKCVNTASKKEKLYKRPLNQDSSSDLDSGIDVNHTETIPENQLTFTTKQTDCVLNRIPKPSEYVALDCEFVGVGKGRVSALGRCSIVDYYGKVLCDIYARPNEPITDYRTPWSGIRRKDMVNAVPFESAKNAVKRIIQDKIVVGHAVHNDFQVLDIHHPSHLVRDTAKYKPLRTMASFADNNPVSLKRLSEILLKRKIQRKAHCSVEDARATVDLFKLVEKSWSEENLVFLPKSHIKKKVSATNSSQIDNDLDNTSFLSDEFWPDDIKLNINCP